jgi:hypothetical protein
MAISFLLRSAICLIGLAAAGLTHAGNLDRCDIPRITARNAVLDTYSHVFDELKNLAPRGTVDMPALMEELNRRESTGLAEADRRVANTCNDAPDELDSAVQAAGALARRNISAVLTRRLTNVDSTRLLP